ncbi:hypothetical protein [Halobacterium noricense]|uniref:hypothetical protein n=1 Tax=Halobacterium noricense TaxID=223182 RepID=UPI001E607558|nr:hypothetical protein [Halobacterium noricense]UHH25614.1 hypothetical protein LT974_01420 [Halobacterium noricense]
MSDDIEGEEEDSEKTWDEYVLDVFVGISFLIGIIVVCLVVIWFSLQMLVGIQNLLTEAHSLMYTLTNPMMVGLMYGIVLSYIVYRGRERWGDRLL